MTERIPQSITKRVVFRAFLSSDHVSVATGKTIAITISKNGGAFGNPAAGATNATAISSGYYYFDLGTGDTGTLGPLAYRGAEGTIDDVGDVFEVVAATNAGFSALPNAAADAAGGLPISDAGGLDLDAKLANTNEVTAARMGALTDWINGGRLDLILDDILADTADMQPKLGTPAGASISADIAAVLAAVLVVDDYVDSIVADVLAGTVEGSITLVQAQRLMLAALVGKLSGAATTTVSIRDTGDSKNRVVATVTADGDRTAVTLDGT